MSEKTTRKAAAPAPAPNKQKMTAEDCARLGLDPSVYGHKAK
jgi:hypothetical protein